MLFYPICEQKFDVLLKLFVLLNEMDSHFEDEVFDKINNEKLNLYCFEMPHSFSKLMDKGNFYKTASYPYDRFSFYRSDDSFFKKRSSRGDVPV